MTIFLQSIIQCKEMGFQKIDEKFKAQIHNNLARFFRWFHAGRKKEEDGNRPDKQAN